MGCLEAQEVLSEAIDREVDAASLAEARAHCDGCADCAKLEHGLDLLSRAAAPAASSALVERIIALAAEEAAAIREAAASAANETPVKDAPIGTPVVQFVPPKWTPRLTAFASIAAMLLVALVATGIGLGGLLRGERAATDTASTSTEYSTSTGAPLAAPGTDAGSTDASKDLAGRIAAPSYVVLDGLVYAPTGQRAVDVSSLVTATPVVTALDTGTNPLTIPAFRVTGESRTIVLEQTPGTYLGFSTISRKFGGRRFVLTSGANIAAYGAWPLLPSRFAVPTSPDGSPTFSFFGKDDAGVLIYVPAGGAPTNGFAVAPGASPGDPAAENPNWTWWQPE